MTIRCDTTGLCSVPGIREWSGVVGVVQEMLNKTHVPTYMYIWRWESWELRDLVA